MFTITPSPEVGPLADTLRLAYVLWARGAFAEAAPLRRRQLEATERQKGAEDVDTLSAAGNLATVLAELGRLAEARGVSLEASAVSLSIG